MSTHMKKPVSPATLIHANRLILATNRGPVEYSLTQKNTLKGSRGAGGLVTALVDAGNDMDVTWVALTMTDGDRAALKEAEDGLLPSPLSNQKMHLRYVAIPKAAYRKHYENICNRLLWFLQHYLYVPTKDTAAVRSIQDAWEQGYCVANQAIADAISAEIEREETTPVVMLHDYHLYLAPALIRKKHPTVVMQQFVHIPWPDIRCWHFLPSTITHDIYRGLVANDIIGFQSERDAQNFLEGAHTLLDGARIDFEEHVIWWQGHRTRVHTYPISISVAEERSIVRSKVGKRAAEKIRPFLGEKTLMRVDRIEPTKNIVRGFQAYAHLLEEHPDLQGRVTFLAFLVPSRQTLPAYRRYRADVERVIEEINQKYGTDTWTPIHAFIGNDRTRALAAMQSYDVLLVNPIIDGMNLVAKEGAVVNQRNGVLILSRTAGAFEQLGKASIPTSPTDVVETAQAIYKALTLSPEERRVKALLVQQMVEHENLNAWLTQQMSELDELLVGSDVQHRKTEAAKKELAISAR